MASTFYEDGYRDRMNDQPPSPPKHPETNVYTQEYRAGYHQAGRDILNTMIATGRMTDEEFTCTMIELEEEYHGTNLWSN